MKDYIRTREKQERRAILLGAGLTIALHGAAITCLGFSGFAYIYPPPQEQSFLIDFEEDQQEEPSPQLRGSQPQAEEVDLTKPIELVQKSQSPYISKAENLTPASTPDDFGDIDIEKPEQEPVIDPRASFPGMAKKDTSLTAPHSASESSPVFKAGQENGNTEKGRTDGSANAHLKGRNVIGTLPRPTYNLQQSGVVVVRIRVNQYGTVESAVAGVEGTTVTDKTLWAAARKAAMESHFNQSSDAPAVQEGTITYIFKLK